MSSQSSILRSPHSSNCAIASPLSVATRADFPTPFTFLALSLPITPMSASGAYYSTTAGGWIMSDSAVASFPAEVNMASSTRGLKHSRHDHSKPPTHHLSYCGSPPLPRCDLFLPCVLAASGAYLSTMSCGWIMSSSSVVSFPANVETTRSPAGCWDKKLDTFGRTNHHPPTGDHGQLSF